MRRNCIERLIKPIFSTLKNQLKYCTAANRAENEPRKLPPAAEKPKEKQVYARPLILGIETSCDDTGVAVLDGNGKILGECLISQQSFSTRFGGVVPLFAANQHEANIEPAVTECLRSADLSMHQVDAIAVTVKPGLVICLRKGVDYALKLCHEYGKPLIPVHHMRAHALTARMINDIPFPYMCLLVSGGHSLITWVESIDKFYIIGKHTDIAPGDALDKISRRLNLPHFSEQCSNLSGGVLIERFAKRGDPFSYSITPPGPKQVDCNFYFGGILSFATKLADKLEAECGSPEGTAVGMLPKYADVCASVQHAVFKHMAKKLIRAFHYVKLKRWVPLETARQNAGQQENIDQSTADTGQSDDNEETEHGDFPKTLVISGGVASNQYIRRGLSYVCRRYGCKLICPPPKFCTDNGVMIAWNGLEIFRAGGTDILYRPPQSYYCEPKSPIGRDMIDDVIAHRVDRKKVEQTHPKLKLDKNFNDPANFDDS